MAMPFPGMDPYLEHPALWPGVHTRLIVALANQLRPRIRPRYVASVEDRVFIEGPADQRIPDVWVQRIREDVAPRMTELAGVATPVIVEVEPLEVHESYIEILDLYREHRVVTVIEVVSPSNKTAGPGRKSYLEKQGANLASDAHLVEIDLLRRGRHVLAVPRSHARAKGPYHYLTCVCRAQARCRMELYHGQLRERLPTIRLPLAEPDSDVPLDIQAALGQVYEDGDYMLRVRYDEPCKPRLKKPDQQWANECWAAYKAARPELFPPAQSGPDGAPSTSK